MIKRLFLAALIASAVLLSSCLTSLNRLVTYSTVTNDNRISGNWQFEALQIKIESIPVSNFYKELLASIKTKEELKSAFDSREDSILYSNSYVAEFVKNGYQYYMICSQIKLGGNLFVNMEPVEVKPINTPNDKEMEEINSGGSHMTSNSIAKLVFKENEVEFQFINPDFIRSQLKNGRLAIKYEKDDLFNTDLSRLLHQTCSIFLPNTETTKDCTTKKILLP